MRALVVLLLLLGTGVLVLGRLFPGALADNREPVATGGGAPRPTPTIPAGRAPTATVRADRPPTALAQKGEVTVEITDSELTQRLNQQLAGQSLGQTPFGEAIFERVQVSLHSGQADASGSARIGSASVPFTSLVTAQPASNGGVRVEISEARVAGMPMPDSARAQFEVQAQRQVDQLLAHQPLRVRSVEIGGGRLRAIGTPG